MTSRSRITSGRSLLRLAVVGAVAAGAPVVLAGTAEAAPGSAWDRLAQCESGGNWNTNTGTGYYGGIQFNAQTWRAYGGSGLPHQASRAEQIAVAERTLAAQGWNAWPACSRKMGLRGDAAQPGKAAPAARKASAPAARKASAPAARKASAPAARKASAPAARKASTSRHGRKVVRSTHDRPTWRHPQRHH